MNVAVLFGGRSTEHEISVITAMQTMAALFRHRVFPVFVDREGNWRLCGNDFEAKDYADESKVSKQRKVAFMPDGFLYSKGISGYNKRIKIDVAVLCFHGKNGEDGTAAGLMEMYGIPCVNSSIALHSVAIDKRMTKVFAKGLKIPTLPFISAESSEDKEVTADRAEYRFEYPLVVKPNSLGSSIAVSAVHDRRSLIEALTLIYEFDKIALIEPCLTDFVEINCACYRNDAEAASDKNDDFSHKSGDNNGDVVLRKNIVVSQTERPVGNGEILDFCDKYMTFGKNGVSREFPYVSPFSDTIRRATAELYDALDGRGVMRADFLVCGDGFFLNEINAIPGSMGNYLFDGTFAELMENLIYDAVERHNKRNVSFVYKSGVLSGGKLRG